MKLNQMKMIPITASVAILLVLSCVVEKARAQESELARAQDDIHLRKMHSYVAIYANGYHNGFRIAFILRNDTKEDKPGWGRLAIARNFTIIITKILLTE